MGWLSLNARPIHERFMRLVTRFSKIFSLLGTVMLAACSAHENTEVSGLGWIIPSLQVTEEPSAPVSEDFALTIRDLDGIYSHTWDNANQFPEYESYQVGSYVARAVSGRELAEGYGCQCYAGETEFQVLEAARIDVPIHCDLTQAMWYFQVSESFKAKFPGASIVAHVADYQYLDADLTETRPLLLMPGETYFFITIKNAEGKSASLVPSLTVTTMAASAFTLNLDLEDDNCMVVSCGSQEARLQVDDSLFDEGDPYIRCEGFESDQTVTLTEGYPFDKQIKMIACASGGGLESVILTVMTDPVDALSYTGEYNLMEGTSAVIEAGLEVSRQESSLDVDFNKLLENLTINQNTEVTFVMQARDVAHKVSPVAILRANIGSVEMEIVSQTAAVVGVDKAQIVLQANASEIEAKDVTIWQTDDFGNVENQLEITQFSLDPSTNQITLDFDVETGVNPVPVRIDFMGLEKISTQVERKVPDFSIGIDPFATSALIVVSAETPEITKALLEYMKVYANGKAIRISTRLPEHNLMWITGLDSSKDYTIEAVVIAGQTTAQAKIHTESASQIPMGDFEDAEEDWKYTHLPCGGAYSAASFPIYNQQNYMDWTVWWPTKYWANVNAKTFCRQAKNHNTWYMQPSSVTDFDEFVSGSKSIRISSVGWSLDGEEISPYMQAEGEYLPYNPNVPYVEHRSAGRLFLGSYSFNSADCTETYNEGISFSSRPYSLNGYYKYEPDITRPNDEGYVEIEFINDSGDTPITIAKASAQLPATPGFVAFNLPLEYEMIGVKATRLKVMFCSSIYYGDIATEDEQISVTANPEKAWYQGSSLWVDNLSFAY